VALQKFFRTPRLEVKVESPLDTTGLLKLLSPTVITGLDDTRRLKTLQLRVTAKRASIHKCKAKITHRGESDYLVWEASRRIELGKSVFTDADESKDLLQNDDVYLVICDFLKTENSETLTFNFRERTPMELQTWIKLSGEPSLTVQIEFLSEEGPLNKKPYTYRINMESWDKANLVELK